MDNLEQTQLAGNPDDPTASAWLSKVLKANKYYNDWSQKFKCNEMEEYFYGFQWKDGSTAVKYDRYTINFIFSTIEIKKPSLIFQNLIYHVKARPAAGEFDFVSSSKRATVREDLLNTIVSDEKQEFDIEFEAFIVDAFFRFGIMEIGYSANWIDNPNAGKPILRSDVSTENEGIEPGSEEDILREPKKIPQEEKIYFKRILPWRFRVGGIDGFTFKKCSWVGYYDYVRVQDLRANPNLKNVDKLEWSGARSEDFPSLTDSQEAYPAEQSEELKGGDMVKIWHLWDIRANKKLIVAESQCVTLLEEKYELFPLVALKYINKLRGWYPLPLVFNWKSPQDEINEAREQQRIHRRRGVRKYLYADGAFADDGEIDKLENGGDMTFAKTTGPPADKMIALPSAPLDAVVMQSLQVSESDLNIITGTPSEQRGQAEETTATQANLTNQNAQVRDSRARIQVANVIREIGRLVLLTVQKHFTSSFWVRLRTNRNNEGFMQEVQDAQEEWRQFSSEDIGDDEDFDVDISVDSISPIENGAEKAKFIEFLSLTTQFPQIAFDPILVREAAYRCGYRNEKVIARMAQMAQIAAIGQIEQGKQNLQMNAMKSGQMGAQPPSPVGNLAAQRVQQMQTPDMGKIQTQLAGQVGGQK